MSGGRGVVSGLSGAVVSRKGAFSISYQMGNFASRRDAIYAYKAVVMDEMGSFLRQKGAFAVGRGAVSA